MKNITIVFYTIVFMLIGMESVLNAQEVDFIGYASIGFDNSFNSYHPDEIILIPPVDFSKNMFTVQQFVHGEEYVFPQTPKWQELTFNGTHTTFELNQSNVGYLFLQKHKYILRDTTFANFDIIPYPIRVEDLPNDLVFNPQTEWLINANAPEIVALAAQLSLNKTSIKDVITSVIDWTSKNIIYDDVTPVPFDPVSVLNYKRGICTHFSLLAASIFRALGIPADLVDGKMIQGCVGHTWIKVYVPTIGWIQIEPQVNPYNYAGQVKKYITYMNGSYGIGYNYVGGDWILNEDSHKTYSYQYCQALDYLCNGRIKEFKTKIDSLIKVNLNPMSNSTCFFTKAIYYSSIDSLYKTKSLLDSAYKYGINSYMYSVYSSKEAIDGIIKREITPQILAPINNLSVDYKTILINWKKSAYATKYNLQASSDSAFSNIFLDISLSDTSYIVDSLLPCCRYYLRVSSENIFEKSPWSSITDFFTNSVHFANAGTDQEVCYGDNVTLTALGGISYSWNNGINNGVSFNAYETKDYVVSVLNSINCTDIDTVKIIVKPLPDTPTIALIDDTLYSNINLEITWFKDDVEISGEHNEYFKPLLNGIYYAYANSNGCVSGKSNSVPIVITGLNNPNNFEIKVYPNPTNGLIFIVQNSDYTENNILEILDSNGMIVYKKYLKQKNLEELDLTHLGAGIYIIRILNKGNMNYKKLVIQ
jgi:transglutaminase-like putative cysteine protease